MRKRRNKRDWVKKGFAQYRERDEILKSMGFNSYAEYLESDIWKNLRAYVLKKMPICFACTRPSTQVHHRMYSRKVLEGKSDAGLFATCAGCHFKAEFRDKDHKKLNPRQATAKLKQMQTWREKRKQAFADWFAGEGD